MSRRRPKLLMTDAQSANKVQTGPTPIGSRAMSAQSGNHQEGSFAIWLQQLSPGCGSQALAHLLQVEQLELLVIDLACHPSGGKGFVGGTRLRQVITKL